MTDHPFNIDQYDEAEYTVLRAAALALIPMVQMNNRDPDRLLADLRPMLDEAIDEF